MENKMKKILFESRLKKALEALKKKFSVSIGNNDSLTVKTNSNDKLMYSKIKDILDNAKIGKYYLSASGTAGNYNIIFEFILRQQIRTLIKEQILKEDWNNHPYFEKLKGQLDKIYSTNKMKDFLYKEYKKVKNDKARAKIVIDVAEDENFHDEAQKMMNDLKGIEPLQEKSVSKSQQRFFGMVDAAQKGEKPASKEIGDVAKKMKKKDVKDFARTKHTGLPERVPKNK